MRQEDLRKPSDEAHDGKADALDDYFSAHLSTCEHCRSLTDVDACDSATAFHRIVLHARSIELLEEPAFRGAVTELQKLRIDDLAGSTEPGPPEEPGMRVGNYQLLEPIAFGGMGRVYRAIHVDLKRIVALKLIAPHKEDNPAAVDRFRREMRALGRFNHPHVVRATDAGEDSGRFYLVMELIDGLDLATLTARLGKIPVPDAAELIRQAALGVQAIHQQGIFHRDVKPANIILARDGVVRVLDLGLSKFASWRDDELTRTGQILGTRRYMAPEQFQTSDVDARTDLYGLGASLACLLRGSPPSVVPTDCDDPALDRDLDAVPAELATIIRRFTARRPEERDGTAGDLAASLQPWCDGSDLQRLLLRATEALPTVDNAESPPPHHAVARTGRNRRWWRTISVGLCFAALAALGGWGVAVWRRGRLETPPPPKPQSVANSNRPAKSSSKTSAVQSPAQREHERRVALWVLKQGGQITKHPHGRIRKPDEIPETGLFRIRKIWLTNRGVSNVDLKQFRSLSALTSLVLNGNPRITDAGLAELSTIKTLRWLYLGQTKVTDAGLVYVNRLTNLESLDLSETTISPTGLNSLRKSQKLRELLLAKTNINDDGLIPLANFPGLVRLDLSSTRITIGGLRHLENLRNLKEVFLRKTSVTQSSLRMLRQKLPGCEFRF